MGNCNEAVCFLRSVKALQSLIPVPGRVSAHRLVLSGLLL